MKITVYNLKAEKVGEMELNPNIFEVSQKMSVIRQVLNAQLANSRKVLAHTKGRSEVRGGGKKPWKQKGTGRARHGSIRSPLWIGGGVTFGPTKDRNFGVKVNKKMKKKALNMILSDKAACDKIFILDELKLEKEKTKDMIGILKNFKDIMKTNKTDETNTQEKKKKIEKDKKVLMLYADKAENLIRVGRNLEKLKIIGANNLNIKDILNYEYLMMPKDALKVIEKLYSMEKKEKGESN